MKFWYLLIATISWYLLIATPEAFASLEICPRMPVASAVSNQFITAISASGAVTQAQPSYSNLSGNGSTSITTVGTIGTGTWQGTKVGLAYGGTNADLSATGGTSQVLKQTSSGAAITVARLACADLSNAATSCSTDTTNASNISSGTLSASLLPASAVQTSAATTQSIQYASLTSSGTVNGQTGSFITGVTHSTGSYTYTLTGFTGTPACFCNPNGNSTATCVIDGEASNSMRVLIRNSLTQSLVDASHDVMCVGQK